MNSLRFTVMFSLILGLAGCQFGITDHFDSMREQQINSYHKKVVEFVTTTVSAHGTEQASYRSAKSTQFYAEQRATLSNLVINAEASNNGQICPIATASTVLASDWLEKTTQSTGSDETEPANNQASCTVIVLRHLRTAHDTLEAIHADNKYLFPPASDLALAAVEDAVRIALRNEAAKK